ncbi:hypothetical protein M2440_000827 [Methylorubrum extorquens]|nr:hypothetical protein [Methylorubrum extorquens]
MRRGSCGTGFGGGGLRELAEAGLLARLVADDALGDGDLARRYAPLVGGGGDQHGAGGRTRLAELEPGIGDRRRAAGALDRAHQQVGVELGVGRGEGDAHLPPIRVEFIGEDGGEPGRVALAHIEMLDHHRDGVVGGDPHEGIGLGRGLRQRVRGFRGAGTLQVEAEGEQHGTRRRTAEEGAPRGDGRISQVSLEHAGLQILIGCGAAQASVRAASWMAARMRW